MLFYSRIMLFKEIFMILFPKSSLIMLKTHKISSKLYPSSTNYEVDDVL